MTEFAEVETDYLNTGTFDEVFRSLYPRLYRHASYVVGQLDLKPADVEDILQTAALRAKENWDTYQQGTYALAWFKAIISNTAKNLRRKTFYNKEVNFENFSNEIDMAGYRSPSAESIAIQQIRLDELRALFDQVNEPLRESLKLVLLDEMPYQAVAEKLNIPINTVLTRVYRGRAKLRELITEKRNLDGEA
jgi:RNA polymerase sigma-70 factor (ECF subfamily)